MILNDKNLNDCIAQSGKNALFYFYWGHRPSGIAAGLKKPGRVIVARFHRVDLYEELFENRGYIPFQKLVLDSLTEAIFVSEHGAGYVKGKYPGLKTPVSVHRLGSFNDGSLGLWQTADSIRVISCSLVDENKRVQLIAQALSHLTIPVSWVHIGEGPLLNKIREYCAQNKNDQFVFEFTGRIANENLHEIYKKRPFDLFVNVSSSEGVPFSIMEALSYGVPVIATAVGGTAEIVDDSCGKILPGQLSAADLMAAINEFYETGFNEKMKMRQEARNKWEKMCDAKTNLRNFLSFLTQIQN